MLFRKKEITKPQLPQKEREAIVDLLHLCLYADSHISLKEGEVLSDVVDVIGWETQSSFSSYEARSISSARAAKESNEAKKEFLAFVAERLQTKSSRELAIDLCKQLFASDGATVEKEATLLGEIRGILK
jgi:hypothetical protein